MTASLDAGALAPSREPRVETPRVETPRAERWRNPLHLFTEPLAQRLAAAKTLRVTGRVVEVIGTLVKAHVPNVRIGEICEMRHAEGHLLCESEVVGFHENAALLTLYGNLLGISGQTEVVPTGRAQEIGVGQNLLGRVIDGLGQPLDSETHGPLSFDDNSPIYRAAPDPLSRRIIKTPMPMGLRALDGLLTCGEGQRIGVFAAAGVGKSTLLSSLVLGASADVIVIALIGERGREVREFIEHNLGEEGMRRSVVVIATSDRSSMERARAAYVATAIAEYFRDQSQKVLLLMDSVTRFARALREIGLAAGEPPTRRGFPPSVFATLPQLMERAGMNEKGSITAFYTVLVEGDDMTEPVADETRSILDGHIILSRDLASANHYPAVDILASASRVMPNVAGQDHLRAAGEIRRLMAAYKEVQFLIKIGEYKRGQDALTDRAVEKMEAIHGFLRQAPGETSDFDETLSQMDALCEE